MSETQDLLLDISSDSHILYPYLSSRLTGGRVTPGLKCYLTSEGSVWMSRHFGGSYNGGTRTPLSYP